MATTDHRRGRTRLARLLSVPAALLLAFTSTPALAEAPAPASAPAAPANPSPHPQKTELLLPKGTSLDDREAIHAAAQRLVDDPRGRELIRVWRLWARTRRPPQNISIHWFDFNWMHDHPEIPGWLQNDTAGFVDRLLTIPPLSDSHHLMVSDVSTETRGALYDRLGVPKTGLLLQVAAGNTLRAEHSEENALNWFERALRAALNDQATAYLGPGRVGRKTIGPLIRNIMQASPRGLAGQRLPCEGRCDVRVQNVPNALAIAYYGKHGSAANKHHAALAQQTVPDVMRTASSKLRRRPEGADQPAKNLGIKPQAAGGQCPIGGLGGHAGGGRPMALSAVRFTVPCETSAIDKMIDGADLGGVDFSSLQMRYMSDSPSGVKYAFSGRPASGSGQDPEKGLEAVTAGTADLRTWLVLDPSSFWVNLNPSEPHRIVDDRLGQTNAGRALLEADFAMKRTHGRLLDPKTDFGRRYWRELLDSTNGNACYSSRMWIVPGDVQVREDGDSLYVIKADLSVQAKPERVAGMPCTPDPQANAVQAQLEQRLVVPKIIEAVNQDPEYAPLRRAFLARVIAQWIRDRHRQGRPTSFDKLIDSGDIGPAKLRSSWTPRQVFDRYVRSVRDGEFTYEMPSADGRAVYKLTFGGVDFAKVDPTRLSEAEMDRRSPLLPQTVKASENKATTASDGTIWLGETAHPVDGGLLARAVDSLRTFATGRNGVLAIVIVGLLFVTFGFRMPRRKRGQAS